jgi:hypothetical protein
VQISEPNHESRGVPFDIIILEKRTSTGTWISTNYYPVRDHILRSLESIFYGPSPGTDVRVYADVQLDTEEGAAAVWGLEKAKVSSSFGVYNVGHAENIEQIGSWLRPLELPPGSIIQVSFKGKDNDTDRVKIDAVSAVSEWAKGIALLITFGIRGASLVTSNRVVHYEVKGLQRSFTAGAGAVLSATLLRSGIAADWTMPVLEAAVGAAVQAATSYVHRATYQQDPPDISLW